ncbi:conserved hypothetical protein [Ricinus communis]|uniref:Uncharacterized protein n=1 Tax=Ricinus communis TaxID=3988 RepID=B9STH9_RICCO|nr:conserved hypothetical protein [Ricinus communis]
MTEPNTKILDVTYTKYMDSFPHDSRPPTKEMENKKKSIKLIENLKLCIDDGAPSSVIPDQGSINNRWVLQVPFLLLTGYHQAFGICLIEEVDQKLTLGWLLT